MKHLLMLCCLFAGSFQMVYGQQKEVAPHTMNKTKDQNATIKILSKTEFSRNVKEMNEFIEKSDLKQAEEKYWQTVKLMTNELNRLEEANNQIMDAVEKKRMVEIMHKMHATYLEIIKLRTDLVRNRTVIVNKLREFEQTLL